MKQFLYLSAFLFCLVSCTTGPYSPLPELTAGTDGPFEENCATVFPQGKWQFSHAIDFVMGSKTGTPVIGVTSLDGKDIFCALVTVEGLTLFEANFHPNGGMDVKRAIPPFDSANFAAGLREDLRAIFEPPAGSMKAGRVGTMPVCRYIDEGVGIVDVLPDVDGCWQIKSYTPELKMNRSIIGQSCKKKGPSLIPDYLELKTYGQTGYTLKMTLITADNIK
ncbi:hypothetical protein [Desulforhopalus sp. IMCC35007]|uniref:hypothetical protein n=1 Tax=Desulforhopalus sp. IMCC35007 TaxID=2569543 RepID=UPI0010AE3325|nr:hypothetical protein [Desulforhopalus sp. IMCC35007]TKB10827.1 hypothetical protein FCL48_06250 [Desulforhopalus sp. IMCC35007]